MKLKSAIVFADSAVDTSAENLMLVTDVELRSQVDQKKLAKDEKNRQRKLRQKEEADRIAAENVDKTLTKELAVASQAASKGGVTASGDILIENFDLTFGSVQLVQNGELSLARGKRYGLVGRNGAGKSTLLRALESRSLQLPDSLGSKFSLLKCSNLKSVATKFESCR